jgi:hypothetical protein
MFNTSAISGISLDAAGLVALADLATISERTALTGTASFLDILLLAPGIHRQQAASEVNGGELPTTGAMTTGYVFRVENQATVSYLQKIGKPGHLVNVSVAARETASGMAQITRLPNYDGGVLPMILYLLPIAATIATIVIMGIIKDYWAVGVILMLILARFINVVVIKRRAKLGWKGISEKGVKGDLLILLSQDRWIRLQGLVDDLKAVTAGQWLRDESPIEGFSTSFATLLVYLAAALASNASTVGSLFILVLLFASVAMLGLCNTLTESLQMHDCIVNVVGKPKSYIRRLDMAKDMIDCHNGRNDWAIGMGLIVAPEGSVPQLVTV